MRRSIRPWSKSRRTFPKRSRMLLRRCEDDHEDCSRRCAEEVAADPQMNRSIAASRRRPYWLKRDYHAGPEEIGQGADDPRIHRQPAAGHRRDSSGSYAARDVLAQFGRHLHHTGWHVAWERELLSRDGGNITTSPMATCSSKATELPHKSLCLIPYRIAIAMEDRGWIIRNVIIWHKPDGMPESVQDRFTVDYEPVFLLHEEPQLLF